MLGIMVLIILALIALVLQDILWFQKAALIVAVIGVGGPLLLSGAGISGDKHRAQFAYRVDDGGDRAERYGLAGALFFWGLPCIIALIITYKVL